MINHRIVLTFPSITSDIYNIEMMDMDGCSLFEYSLYNLKRAYPNGNIYVESKSRQITDLCESLAVKTISTSDISSSDFMVSAYQPFMYMLSPYKICHEYRELSVTNHANYMMALYIIDSLHKYESSSILKQEKASKIINNQNNDHTICLIGDSLFEYWDIDELANRKVFNAGIGDLTSKECLDWIIPHLSLENHKDYFIILGTNDLKYKIDKSETVSNILSIVRNIFKNRNSHIYFLLVPNVYRRWDRRNDDINQLNALIKVSLNSMVDFIDMSFLNNEYGELDMSNTVDGLHFSSDAYIQLKSILEIKLKANE